VLDAVAHNNWKRPMCFAVTSGSEAFMGLEKYFQLQGLVYVLTPIKSPGANVRSNPGVGVDQMYDNMMHKFRWGNMGKDIYLDENIIRMATQLRYQSSTLADALLSEHKKDSALKILNLCMDSISEKSCPYDGSLMMIDRAYFQAGAIAKADTLAKKLFTIYEKNLVYYNSLVEPNATYYSGETYQAQQIMEQLYYYCEDAKQDILVKDFQARLESLNKRGFLQKQGQQ